MSLKKNLKSYKAQAIVEYIMVFIILAAAIITIFGGFNLGDNLGDGGNLSIRSVFSQAVDYAITQIQR